MSTAETGLSTRVAESRAIIAAKPLLRGWYDQVYDHHVAAVERAPSGLPVLELGSGGGYLQEVLPHVVTSEVEAAPDVDRVVDAAQLPYADAGLSAVVLTNVFHHLPDPAAFLHEAERCLVDEGRVSIVDQHPGWLARPIYRYAHPEPFDAQAEWGLASGESANGAQTHNVFVRDRARFEARFVHFELVRYERFSPLLYWLSGGLSAPSLLPGAALAVIRVVEAFLLWLSPDAASFVAIELRRRPREERSA